MQLVFGSLGLDNEHAVPIGIETVAFPDCLAVSFKNELTIGKGTDEHEEGALGEMEICQERIDHLELVGRVDENISAALAGMERSAASTEVLQSAGDSRADCDDSFGLIDFCSGLGAEAEVFLVHTVLPWVLHRDGPEGADADMEGEKGMRVAGQNLWGEVQAGGRRGNRSIFPGKDGLVTLPVGFFLLTINVGRKGKAPMNGLIDWRVPGDEPVSLRVDFHDRSGTLTNLDTAADLHPLARPDEASPLERIGVVEAEEFGAPVIRKEAGREDTGVVEDESIVGTEQRGEIGELLMSDRACSAIHHQHP